MLVTISSSAIAGPDWHDMHNLVCIGVRNSGVNNQRVLCVLIVISYPFQLGNVNPSGPLVGAEIYCVHILSALTSDALVPFGQRMSTTMALFA